MLKKLGRYFVIVWIMTLLCWFGTGTPPIFVTVSAQQQTQLPQYTEEELAYIKSSEPIRICVDPDWYPYEKLDEFGHHVGIGAELVALIAEKSGLKLTVVPTDNWDESIQFSQSGKCDALSMLNKSEERSKWLEFTEPYFVDPNVLITREEHDYVTDLSRLMNETVVLPTGTSVEEYVRSHFPNLKVILVDSEREALNYVEDKKADMTIRSLTMAASIIKHEGLFNLKISGELPELKNQFRIGVVKEKAQLVQILNKAIATITPMEVQTIINHHISIQIKKVVDYRLFFIASGIFFFILVITVIWNIQLRSLNKKLDERQKELLQLGEELKYKNMLLSEQTMFDRLTGIYNRAYFEQRITEILSEQARYGACEMVLCMFDLDHFKLVNDTYGHDQGDCVLSRISNETKKLLRTSDIFARWGGEEFVILFYHTDLHRAQMAAEKIRSTLSTIEHDLVGTVTVSIGLTRRSPQESYEHWFKRTDQAMYSAKHNGRNQIYVSEENDKNVHLYVEWNEQWNSGNRLMDQQHQHLLAYGNKLMALVLQQEPEKLLSMMEDLLNHIVLHFKSEEKLLAEIDFDRLEEHKMLHEELVHKGLAFKERLIAGTISAGDALNFIVNTIIMEHMIKEDCHYYPVIPKG